MFIYDTPQQKWICLNFVSIFIIYSFDILFFFSVESMSGKKKSISLSWHRLQSLSDWSQGTFWLEVLKIWSLLLYVTAAMTEILHLLDTFNCVLVIYLLHLLKNGFIYWFYNLNIYNFWQMYWFFNLYTSSPGQAQRLLTVFYQTQTSGSLQRTEATLFFYFMLPVFCDNI